MKTTILKISFALLFTLNFTVFALAQKSLPSDSIGGVEALEPQLRQVFILRDLNGDGVIKGKEYEAWGGGAKLYDLNNDGVIYPSEYARYFAPVKQDTQGQKDAKFNVAASKPKPGKYSCFGYGLNASGGTSGSYVYKGTFTLEAGNRYTANNTKGTFSISKKDNKTIIRFHAGAYANLTGEVKWEKNSQEIVLDLSATRKGGIASKQYCSCEK